MNWFELWLTLHILAAIVAFGPTFVFPIMGPAVGRHPEHAGFGLEIMEVIETRLVIPFALTMPLSGLGLIRTARVDVFASQWLLWAIVLYVIALGIAFGNQVPATAGMLKIVRSAQAGGLSEDAGRRMGALAARARTGGMLLTVLLITIVVLMIWRPGAAFA